jgi:hypothetical protein
MTTSAEEIESLHAEVKALREALAYAVKEADGWCNDSDGAGPVKTEEMDRARLLLRTAP